MHHATSVSKCLHPCLFNYTYALPLLLWGRSVPVCSCFDLCIPLGLLIIFSNGCRLTDFKDRVSSSTVSQLHQHTYIQHPVFIAKPFKMSWRYKMVMVLRLDGWRNSHAKIIAFTLNSYCEKHFGLVRVRFILWCSFSKITFDLGIL